MVDVSGDRDSDRLAVATQRSLGELFGEVSRELGALVQQEVELAKEQIREESDSNARLELRFGLMAVTGGLALLFLSLALAWGLAEIMPAGFAFLVVGLLYAAATAVLVVQNRRAGGDETDEEDEDEAITGLDRSDGVNGSDVSDGSSDRRIQISQGRVELR